MVSGERAWRIRLDVLLYYRNRTGCLQILPDAGPDTYMAAHLVYPLAPMPIHWLWKDYDWFVEVDDPNKDEYVPDE